MPPQSKVNWGDQLTSYDGTAITYDAQGNPLNWRDGMSFSWTERQLDSITKSEGTVVSFTYDANGMRTEKTVGDESFGYVWQNGKLIAESYEYDEYLTQYYIYDENGSPVAWSYLDEYYYYIKNQQGDITGFTDSEGNIVVTYEYDAWGNLLSYTGTWYLAEYNSLRYRGYAYDNETGLYYLQARYYDPKVGRFINADNVEYIDASGTVIGCNLYAYCENNPINLSDKFGSIAGVDDATVLLFIALCVLTVGLVSMVSSSGFQQAWLSFCTAVGNGLSSIGNSIVKGGQAVWNWSKSKIKSAIAALTAFSTVLKAHKKILEKVKRTSKDRYWTATLYSTYVDLGRPISYSTAVGEVSKGRNVFTVTKEEAEKVARAASNKSKPVGPEIDSGKKNTIGYYYHYHKSNRKGHVFYLY